MKPFLIIFSLLLLPLLGGSNLQAMPLAEEGSEASYSDEATKEKSWIRHAKGMHGLGVVGGYASISPIIGIEWSWKFKSSWQFKILGSGGWKYIKKSRTTRSLSLQPMFSRTVYTDYEGFLVNVGMGLQATLAGQYKGWKRIKERARAANNNNINRSPTESPFNLGLTICGEVEMLVFNRLVLTLATGPVVSILKNPADRLSFWIIAGIKINM